MDALYGHAASSYMAGLMRPAYNLCNSEGGNYALPYIIAYGTRNEIYN